MRNKAGLILTIALLAIALTWSVGCRKSLDVDFPKTLIGEYTGTYTLLAIDGIDTLVDTLQFVTFRFTNSTYIVKLNEKLQQRGTLFFCFSEGEYAMENGVIFNETDENLERDVCTPAHNPRGSFGLNQSTGSDTIVIKQDVIDSLGIRNIKTLKLVLEN
jgi:hypothetical protein